MNQHLTNRLFFLQFEDYSYVSFLAFDRTDEDCVGETLMIIDNSIQYGEDLEHKEPVVFIFPRHMVNC